MKQLNRLSKRLLCIACAFITFGYASAQIEVSGKLTNDKGEAMAFADVFEVGTTNGTLTDHNGDWSLSVASEQSVIEFAFMGFEARRITVGTQRVINIRLLPVAQVVGPITIRGYALQDKVDGAGASDEVDGKAIANRPVLSVDQALIGKAAGLQGRSNSGSPGSSMDIVIRGRGTTGDARPLYVVDGVAVGYSYRGDPNNIESITILKDASSTAIYGARGANGVIVIQTKGGNAPAAEPFTTVSFDAYRGVQSAWKHIEVVDAETYARLHNEMQDPSTPAFTDAEIAEFANTNWQDEIFQQAIIQKYKITIEGGNETGSWSSSAGYTNQEGIVRGTDYTRYDFGFKNMSNINDRFKFGSSSGFNVTSRNTIYEGNLEQSAIGAALIADPTIPVYANNGNWFAPRSSSYYHPVGIIEAGHVNTPNTSINSYGLGANVWVDAKITEDLVASTQFNYGRWGNIEQTFVKEYFIKASQGNTDTYMERRHQFGDNWGLTNTLTYNLSIEDTSDSTKTKHNFRFLLGHEVLYSRMETDRYKITGLLGEDDYLQYFGAKTGDSEVNVQDWELPNEHAMLSYFGRIEYSFLNKYLLNTTLRRDGSSRFGDDNKFGLFPAVGLGWHVHREPFFYGNEWLLENMNQFKIRGGWGKVGNENFANYRYAGTMGTDPNSRYSFNKSIVDGAVTQITPNPGLKWEEATSWNIGTDISLYRHRLLFNFDYFVKKNVDNLLPITVPAVVGVDGSGKNPVVNTAEVSNKGYEVSLAYRHHYSKENWNHAIVYDVGVNFAQIENEVVYMAESVIPGGKFSRNGVFVARTMEGYPIAAFFGYKTDGIYQNWEEVNQGNQTYAKPGDLRIVDANGDGRITEEDIVMIGNPHPKFTYGFSANVSYASFDLGLFFQGVHGNQIYNMTQWYLQSGYLYSNFSPARLDAWSPTNTGSDIPADATWYTGKEDMYPLDIFIEDGSYLRLKSVSLGYTLPTTVAQKLNVERCRVYVLAQNLFTFTDYSGFDPEIGTNETTNWEGPEFGIDRGNYPQAKSVVFGINLEF